MKALLAVMAGAIMLTTLLAVPASAQISDPGLPRYTNNMFGDFVTPTVSPGKTVNFAFNLTNPYGNTSEVTMTNIILTVGVYKYATQETSRDVNASFRNPPLLNDIGVQQDFQLEDLAGETTVRMEIPIATTDDTPHGSYFSQSTYFVRFRLNFTFEGNGTHVLLQSRGFFTDAQWSRMVSFEAGQTLVDTDYMRSLGVSGIIPDSSFGIKVPIPRWPLGVLIAACVGVSFLALYYFVLDNPGKYPRLEKRFYYLRGKLHEFRSQLKH